MKDPRTALTNSAEKPSPALYGNTKVTRDDWLAVARDLLLSGGIAEVKVLAISERLGVSRSSFYGYFKSRSALLDALLADWEASNTAALVRHAGLAADTITAALCNVFRCWVNPALFDHKIDFAVREWARRDGAVRRVVDRTDAVRIVAFATMYERFGYDPEEAEVRARILYFMQVGYYALELSEPLDERLKRVENYLLGFTGARARPEEVEAFLAYARHIARSGPRSG